MKLLQGDAFDDLIRSSRREAFHLELQDDYESPDGDEPYRNWVAGGPADDFAWFQDWLNLVRDFTARGAVMRRARVVTVPMTDYQRWMLEITVNNVAAGEDVRYLARHLADSRRLSTDDWWLLDDETVIFTTFETSGRFAGAAVTHDPRIIAHCQEVRDYVWSAAVPYADYAALQTQ
ncbi:DUF6879 family protein [Nocardia sp. CC227C]|uniref:DUF6879 family protein n=1 Tax=Nocardia sp. CC227C TaxID=3044562 RepID=UPI00278C1DF5|nr:DUF6879 family protein [Nocardia sp. CC227C]